MTRYSNTDVGWMPVTSAAVALVLVVLFGLLAGATAYAFLIPLALLCCNALINSRLTVQVTGGDFIVRMGPGWPAKRIAIREIRTVEMVRLPWYDGFFGFHYGEFGVQYGVVGGAGIVVQTSYGGQFCVATREPEALSTAIELASPAPSRSA